MKEKLKVNREECKFNKFNGITLISLVITIVVLIILASVGIYLSLGNNGIFTRAKQAKEETNKQTATEIINLKITTAQMNKYAEKQEMPTLQELADVLYEDNEIQYVALESKVADKEKVTVGNRTSIFTKLNNYPYEFEINSSLQLASIDGIEIKTAQTNNETNMCNQKLLTTLTLANSQDNIRAAGNYYANNNSFIKADTENFNKYLTYSDSEGWKVKLSGWYSIGILVMAQPKNSNGATYMTDYINMNDTSYMLNREVGIEKVPMSSSNFTPMFLEKDTKLNFYNYISQTCYWHYVQYSIYALFN